jgi:hypothetical protein
MTASDSYALYHRKNRTRDWTLTMTDASGAAIPFAAGDVIRVKVGRGSGTPALDVSSYEALSGSTVVAPGSDVNSPASLPTTDGVFALRVAASDTSNMETGAYDMEAILVDQSETAPANAVKHAQSFVFHLQPSLGGEVTDEESSVGN